MKIISRLLITIILTSLIVGCSSKPTTQNYASYIQVVYRTGPTIKSTDSLLVDIRNTSNYCFDFPVDFGIKINMKIGDSNRPVNNLITYSGNRDYLLKAKGDVFDTEIC